MSSAFRPYIRVAIPGDIPTSEHDEVRTAIAAVNESLSRYVTTEDRAVEIAAVALSNSGRGACGRPMAIPTAPDAMLTRAAIAAAGYDPELIADREAFAALTGRDERTVRRWLRGEIRIPPAARAWLENWLTLSDATRSRIVGALG